MTHLPQAHTLSSRGQDVALQEPLPFVEALYNVYNAEGNPEGYVSLGLAENVLMHPEMESFISDMHLQIPSSDLSYGAFHGSDRLREAISSFLNKHLHPIVPVTSSHIVATAGVTNALESTAWSIGDPGDSFLLGRPFYVAFPLDLAARARLKTILVAFGSIDPFSLEAVAEYEKALTSASESGARVRGLVLCSPHNPLGRCYPRATLVALMQLCQRHQIHLISDEIYALSVWKNPEYLHAVEFTSVLSIPTDGIIDPSLVHVLWGMSKDFGANGLRMGCAISQNNPAFLASMQAAGIFTYPSSASQLITAKVLEDDVFTNKYITTNRTRMAESYTFVIEFLKLHSIPFYPGANAGFFIWCNLRACMTSKRTSKPQHDGSTAAHDEKPESDDAILQRLLGKKVYISRGREFGGEEPGWFRIVFTHPKPYLQLALNRMIEALN